MSSRALIFLSTTAMVSQSTQQRDDFFPLPKLPKNTTDDQVEHQATSTDDSQEKNSCDLECLNLGLCRFDDHGAASCSCREGFSGKTCEIVDEECGSSYCRNGSKCFALELVDGSVDHLCDCSQAYTETTYYAGEFCQYPSTSFCSEKDDRLGRQFCVNGGTCPSERHLPCACSPGFSGPRCAYQMGVDGMDYAECRLPCMNGGTCQKGFKPDAQGIEDLYHTLDIFLTKEEQARHVDYEHCVCPPGFDGIRCEYKVEHCNNDEHVCLHGSTCVKQDARIGCNCTESMQNVAGVFCEHIATSECYISKKAQTHRGFCTNGGKCELDSEGSPRCICPMGYQGLYCEFRVKENGFNTSRVSAISLFGVAVSTLAAVVGIVLLLRYYPRNVKTEKKLSVEASVAGFGTIYEHTSGNLSGISSAEIL